MDKLLDLGFLVKPPDIHPLLNEMLVDQLVQGLMGQGLLLIFELLMKLNLHLRLEGQGHSIGEDLEVSGQKQLCQGDRDKEGKRDHFQKVPRDSVVVTDFRYGPISFGFEFIPIDGVLVG